MADTAKNHGARARILYLGAGAPHKATSGMDLVARIHIEELLATPDFEVSGMVAASSLDCDAKATLESFGAVFIVCADAVMSTAKPLLALQKLGYVMAGCASIISFSFRSTEMRRFSKDALASGRYKAVVIDHFATLANISLRDLYRSRIPLVYIAHDVLPVQIRDVGHLKPGKLSKVLFCLEAGKAAFYEKLIVKLARVTIFLSSYDRDWYCAVAKRAEVLLPIRSASGIPPADRVREPHLLFVGSPGFGPNNFAIEWLLHALAEPLRRRYPSLRILLAGKGTERIGSPTANVVGLGFVPEEKLHHLMDTALGLLCPVVHGSGLKMKVLEAVSRGCLVFATKEALRGFGAFPIEPLLEIQDPDRSVDLIAAFVDEPRRAADHRSRIIKAFEETSAERSGKLAAIVRASIQA